MKISTIHARINLMLGIIGFVELLKQPVLSGEDQSNFVGIIEESGKRMLNIINDIISISKVEAGQAEVFISETNINDQIKYIYSFFKQEAKSGSKVITARVLCSISPFLTRDNFRMKQFLEGKPVVGNRSSVCNQTNLFLL